MPRLTTLVLLLATAISCCSLFAADTQPTIQSINKMPLAFTKNMGQWDSQVLFRANAGGATMWFTKDGVTYQFARRIDSDNTPLTPLKRGTSSFAGEQAEKSQSPLKTGTSSFAGEQAEKSQSPLETGTSSFAGEQAEKSQSPLKTGTSSFAGEQAEKSQSPLERGFRGVSDRDSLDQLVLTAKFVGANPNPEVIADAQMEYKCNYFLGNDPSKWYPDVPNYEAITLKDIYPGIDLKYSGDRNGQATYEFIAAPGADIAQIKVAYDGAESTSLDSDGNLILKTKWGNMTAAINSPRPVGEGSGVKDVLSGTASFPQLSRQTLSPTANARSLTQANSGTLSLSYSTYLGGSGDDYGYDIAVDGSGNAFVTGSTLSTDFPTSNPFQTDQGDYDVFVTKLSGSGNTLIYSTYLGGGSGASWDEGLGIAIDSSGDTYVTGWTTSSDFPTLNPYQTYQGGADAFVAKLASTGNSLIYSTYLGASNNDYGWGIAVDGSANAYVTGFTASPNFPTLNPFQGTFQGGTYDAFVTKLSSSGNSPIYSTYLGGGSSDEGYGIAVDGNGDAYVTGISLSSDFPTLNPYQTAFQGGYCDVFVTKLSSTGNSLIYGTYLGGENYDFGYDIGIDGNGNAYVTGRTGSSNFPTLNPYQGTSQGGDDAFVTKLSSTGNSLIYSTYLGGGDWDQGLSIAVNGSGNAYVTGYTLSSDFPTLGPYRTDQGPYDYDVFVTKLSSSGNSLIYSTYLGGESDDLGYGITVDGSGNAYVTGETGSSNFPILNPYDTYHYGGSIFVTKLTWTPEYSCGDVNTDGQVDLLDAVFLINYIFVGGPAPQQLSLADVNCSGSINIADVVLLINYIFRGGTAPCTSCK